MKGTPTLLTIAFVVSTMCSPLAVPNSFAAEKEKPRVQSVRTSSVAHRKDDGAATVFVGGRVMTFDGRPIRNARLFLIDLDGPTLFTASSSFGHFAFTGVVPGRTYVLAVFHQRFIFASPTQTIEVAGNMPNVLLLGEENW